MTVHALRSPKRLLRVGPSGRLSRNRKVRARSPGRPLSPALEFSDLPSVPRALREGKHGVSVCWPGAGRLVWPGFVRTACVLDVLRSPSCHPESHTDTAGHTRQLVKALLGVCRWAEAAGMRVGTCPSAHRDDTPET